MKQNQNKRKKTGGTWLKVFCPDARCLNEEEIASLPEKKRRIAEATDGSGLWLKVFCPDQSCLRAEEQINIPVKRASEAADKGIWLRLFCPEARCLARESTDVP